MNYIFALSGTMYAYRNQLIERRFSMLDAKYLVGQYESDAVTGYIGKGDKDTIIKATASDDYYFAWKTQNGKLTEHQSVQSSGVAVFNFRDAMSQNDPVRLIGASRMRRLDFATTAPHLQGAWNLNSGKSLEEIVATTDSPSPTQWYPLLSKITGLRHIDLTGQRGVTGTEDEQARTFDVSSHTGLEQLKLGGTSVRAVRIAEGSPISLLELPATLSYLRLRALPRLSLSGLTLADWSKVTSLELAGCPLIDWRALLDSCVALERLRIEGVDFEDDGSLLKRLSGIKGIDANGSAVDTCELVGKCQLSVYVDEETIKAYRQHFPSLVIRQPDYTMIEFDDTVADPANISNLDNKTGYKYGTAYKPSGHISKILSERFGCLGKQEVKGQIKICRLHQGDFRFYGDHPNTSFATPAKLDFSEGDLWIYEPQYWYKGVNDIKRMKKYACYATGEKPRSSEGKRLLMEDIKQGKEKCSYLDNFALTPDITLDTSQKEQAGYAVCNIPVAGYKRVRFPSVSEESFFGGVFVDAKNKVIKAHTVASRNQTVFVSGMYWYEDIPDGAVRFAFTVFKDSGVGEDFVWLTNSLRIEDLEPDWVEHKPTLIADFKASIVDGRITSSSGSLGEAQPVASKTLAEFERIASLRGLSIMTWAMRKDVVNLFMAKYGHRDSNAVYGTPAGFYSGEKNRVRLGWCADSGMNDTVYSEGKYFKTLTVGGASFQKEYKLNLAKEMGYENFSWASREFVAGMHILSNSGKCKLRIAEGSIQREVAIIQRDLPPYTYGAWIARVVHGKYMDILPISSLDPEQNNGFYKDRFGLYRVNGVATFGWDHNYSDGIGLFSLCSLEETLSDPTTSARLAFQGDIVEVESVPQYKTITNNF